MLVVYQSKWGNTKTVAEKIAEGMNLTAGIETTVRSLNEVDADLIADSDALLIGSPNHIGKPTGGIKRFISRLGKFKVKTQGIAFFDTYIGKDYEKAVKKMEKHAAETLAGIKVLLPGLSIRVDGMKGPITEGELPKCVEFGTTVAACLTG